MGLNISKGNMYDFVTHTWNTVKGLCPHGCSYCYMRRFGKQRPVRFDAKELKTDLGKNNFIFVGSSCDMWAKDIPHKWIVDTIEYASRFFENKYLFQSKNPAAFSLVYHEGIFSKPSDVVFCTTIETNRFYHDRMAESPAPWDRAEGMARLTTFDRYVTIEPIMDFDLLEMVELIERCEPVQVNIGADSGNSNLPEPSADKVLALIDELQKFTTIARKSNIAKILGKGQED